MSWMRNGLTADEQRIVQSERESHADALLVGFEHRSDCLHRRLWQRIVQRLVPQFGEALLRELARCSVLFVLNEANFLLAHQTIQQQR